MSTRATYQFIRPRHGGRFTIYIHHDGYPLGAAEYFARAVLGCNASGPWSAWLGGSLVEEFIRQNDRAELTADHEQHGDTDYRYTLSRPVAEEHGPDVLTVRSRLYVEGADPWKVVFHGQLVEFLKEQAARIEDPAATEWPSALQSRRWCAYGSTVTSVEHLTAAALDKMQQARHQLEKGWTGNASSSAADAGRFIAAGAEIDRAEFVELLKATCANFPHMIAYHLKEAGLLELATVA